MVSPDCRKGAAATEARLDGATDWAHAVTVCQAEVENHPGDPRFIYALGRAQDHLKNYSEALHDFRVAVEAGHVDAMVELGRLYYSGHGVLQSYSLAFQYFSKAAAAGSSRALVNVAALTGNGQGVAKDDTKALDLAEKAIEAGTLSVYALSPIAILTALASHVTTRWLRSICSNRSTLVMDKP